MSACLSVCLSIYLSSSLGFCSFVGLCLSVYLSVRPPGWLSVRPSVCLSIPLSVCRLSFSLSVCLRVCLFLWDFPEIMMTNGWCDSICLFILQVFTDVSGASTWTHMGRISFLKFQRKDFTWEESEAITAPFLSKCYSYRKQRKQKFPFPVEYFPWADLFEHWMTCRYERTKQQRTRAKLLSFPPLPHSMIAAVKEDGR